MGLRRGLLAFKVLSVGSDIDGSGTVLPELEIIVVDPANIDLSDVKIFGSMGDRIQIVQ